MTKQIASTVRRMFILAGIGMFAAAIFGSQPASAQAAPQVTPVHSVMIDVSKPLPKQIDIYKGGKILFIRPKGQMPAQVKIVPTDGNSLTVTSLMFTALVDRNGQQFEMSTGNVVPPGYYPIFPFHTVRTGTADIQITLPGFAGPVSVGTIALIVH